MGNKFYIVRLITTALLSIILCLVTFAGINATINFPEYIPYLVVLFLAIFGNYLPAVKPNYFVGIRTPWTLEDPIIWE